jgi:monofunctional biosynthetic peptidoglycan transglycosylase
MLIENEVASRRSPNAPGIEEKGRSEELASLAVDCAKQVIVRGTAILIAVAAAAAAALAVLVLLFRFIDPPASTLMIAQFLSGVSLDQRWVPIEAVSPNLIRAVIVSEDGQFCRHRGIDFGELDAAVKQAERNGLERVRGASTITMQVAKNLFLWPGKDFVRKGIELGVAVLIDGMWPKRRVLEVYLNIAEWGPGVFGAEAAARRHFRKPAAKLTEQEAALLAATLPNPIKRIASAPGPGLRHLAQIVASRARSSGQRAACVLPQGAR